MAGDRRTSVVDHGTAVIVVVLVTVRFGFATSFTVTVAVKIGGWIVFVVLSTPMQAQAIEYDRPAVWHALQAYTGT
jgi:hypothetical protein